MCWSEVWNDVLTHDLSRRDITGDCKGGGSGVRIGRESDGTMIADWGSGEEAVVVGMGSLGGLGVALCFLRLESNLSAQTISLNSENGRYTWSTKAIKSLLNHNMINIDESCESA